MGELNGQHVKAVKLKDEFFIVPRKVEHKPVADDEVHILLFEPASALNTGDVQNELTRTALEKVQDITVLPT